MSVIVTDLAGCKNCYGCVRACPVAAMEIKAGHVQVDEQRCIACASCVRACTQKARTVSNGVPLVKSAIAEGRAVVASVSPWLPAFLPFQSFDQAKEVLLRLGFTGASDTTLGEVMVGAEHSRLVHEADGHTPLITTACPGIVHLVEKHYPDMITHLAHVVSPMIAHGRWLKKTLGRDTVVVFVGPCVAAKLEAADEAVSGAVDIVLTFGELAAWLAEEGITIPYADSTGEEDICSPPMQFLPAVGALRYIDQSETDILRKRIVTTTGVASSLHLLESLQTRRLDVDLVEMMLCSGGCIDGPSVRLEDNPHTRGRRVLDYARQSQADAAALRIEWPALDRVFVNKKRDDQVTSEPGDVPPQEDRIPAMVRQAETVARVALELTPNLIIAVDRSFRVVFMSPSAERAFGCDISIVRNRPLEDILSPTDDFVRAWKESRAVVKTRVRYRPDLIVEQTVVPALRENIVLAIMRDITPEESKREELSQLAQETIARTHEVLNFQMQVAHEIASLLGETTAESKIQLTRLIQLMQGLEWLDVS